MIISFSNQKGGVGKSTSCINVGAGLALLGKKVLIVDYDPQGNTTSGLGVKKTSKLGTIYDIICEAKTADECILHTSFENIDLIPSTINLAAAEIELSRVFTTDFNPVAVIKTVAEKYDYVLIDCPPSLGFLTISALSVSDSVIIPLQCEFYALEGLSQLMPTIKKIRQNYNPSLQMCGILATMYNGRLVSSAGVINEIKKYYPGKMFKTPISRAVRLAEAPSYGMPIQMLDPKCKSSLEYNAVAKELIERT